MADFNVRHYLDPSTKGWIVTAIGKLTSQLGQLNDGTRNVLEKHVTATDVELRQVSNEVLRICQRLPFYILCLSYCQSNKGISLSECAIFFPALFRNSGTFSKRLFDAKCATFRRLLRRSGGEWIQNNSVAVHFYPMIGHLSRSIVSRKAMFFSISLLLNRR